jgi:hypothetical protein
LSGYELPAISKQQNVKNSKKWFMATHHFWINKTSKSTEMNSNIETFQSSRSLFDELELEELLG